MALLDVKNVKKIYTTRFGKNQVEALKNVTFVRLANICILSTMVIVLVFMTVSLKGQESWH